MVASLYRYRSFIWQHAVADLRRRYAGTGMGVVWNILHPLSVLAVYAVVFTALVAKSYPGIPGWFGYTIFMAAGFFPWTGFTDCLQRGASAFASNAAYLKKLPIPEQVFAAQTAASATLSLIISFGILVVFSISVLALRPTWYWLLVPIPLVLFQVTGFGLGMILGTLNIFFTDIGQLLGIVLNLLFWLTPIIYSRDKVGLPAWVKHAMAFLPGTPAIEATRALFIYDRMPEPWALPALAAWAVGSVVAGYLVLNALRAEIRDVI